MEKQPKNPAYSSTLSGKSSENTATATATATATNITTAIRIRPLNASDHDKKHVGSFVFKDYTMRGGVVALDPTYYHKYSALERQAAAAETSRYCTRMYRYNLYAL